MSGEGISLTPQDKRTTASRSNHCGPCVPVAQIRHNANETKLYPTIGDASGSPARAIPTGRNQTLQVEDRLKGSDRVGRAIPTGRNQTLQVAPDVK